MITVCVPLYAIIDVNTPEEATRAKATVEQLLRNDFVRMTLVSNGVRVRQMNVGEPYPCEPPPQPQPR
jgi:hypothetical protein